MSSRWQKSLPLKRLTWSSGAITWLNNLPPQRRSERLFKNMLWMSNPRSICGITPFLRDLAPWPETSSSRVFALSPELARAIECWSYQFNGGLEPQKGKGSDSLLEAEKSPSGHWIPRRRAFVWLESVTRHHLTWSTPFPKSQTMPIQRDLILGSNLIETL